MGVGKGQNLARCSPLTRPALCPPGCPGREQLPPPQQPWHAEPWLHQQPPAPQPRRRGCPRGAAPQQWQQQPASPLPAPVQVSARTEPRPQCPQVSGREPPTAGGIASPHPHHACPPRTGASLLSWSFSPSPPLSSPYPPTPFSLHPLSPLSSPLSSDQSPGGDPSDLRQEAPVAQG